MKRWNHFIFVFMVLLFGLAVRYALLPNVSGDAKEYLLPWFAFARNHGLASLAAPFTNYPPSYSYLLILLTHFEWLASPLVLIKASSAVCELGCALLAGAIARDLDGGRWAGPAAFAGVWLAPTVLINGPYWGQSDSMWTLFLLASLWLFLKGRNGVPAFALAFTIKAQTMFMGPFVLGMIVRRRVHWAWLAAIPLFYVLAAAPVLIAGRNLFDVMSVYWAQANFYNALSNALSMNAANPWIFAPLDVNTGTYVGLALAGLAGLLLALRTGRIDLDEKQNMVVAAAASLLLMPFLLPKMHDRYFYAFEVVSIILACANPRYIAAAIVAQADGILSYLMFERHLPVMSLAPAVICNFALVAYLVAELIRPLGRGTIPTAHIVLFAVSSVSLTADMMIFPPRLGSVGIYPYLAATFCFLGIVLLLRAGRMEITPMLHDRIRD